MACPYFLPSEKRDDLLWPHPARLPLGSGFGGSCCAAGHEGEQLRDDELKSNCNIGYARNCPRLPAERAADAVRYAVALESDGRLVISWCAERDHAPAAHGRVDYDCAAHRLAHADLPLPGMARQVERFVATYLERRPRTATLSNA
ncbi:MAG TPA: hypothetical protein VFA60_05540 [Terriglobales bacterium]|nr:hypothetical protein [Terriglobales bacterium]